jgi:tetratricopeptide (TPR) repeat protein
MNQPVRTNRKPARIHRMFAEALGYHRNGRGAEAAQLYRRILAVQPAHADSFHLLGLIAHQAGRHAEAIDMIGQAIAIAPAAAYLSSLGNAFKELGRTQQALQSYHAALDLRPDFEEAHFNLGTLFMAEERLEDAAACYRAALTLKPDYLEAYNNLGETLRRQGRLDQAVACFTAAIKRKPDYLNAYNNLGNTLREQGHLDDAAICYRKILALKPDDPKACNNLGNVLKELRRMDEAVICYRKAIKLRPDFPDAHHNLALGLLARGDLTEGWAEYEWRRKLPDGIAREFPQPQWFGEPADGRTLLIHAEQGFGDTIQFCRYAPLAAATGLRVIIEVPKPLVRLLSTLPGVDRVVASGETPPHFDVHCPMLSMPLALGTTLTTIPCPSPYLRAEAEQAATWARRLALVPGAGPRIGVVWAGNLMNKNDRRRSLDPGLLAPLFGLNGSRFFSLQKSGTAMPAGLALANFTNEMNDFADTAAFIANLDLVISVDTAVAHLAAALGKPVWLLDRFYPDWRWLLDRRDSPWYPTMRIYRQPRAGDWAAVRAEVMEDLRAFCQHSSAAP